MALEPTHLLFCFGSLLSRCSDLWHLGFEDFIYLYFQTLLWFFWISFWCWKLWCILKCFWWLFCYNFSFELSTMVLMRYVTPFGALLLLLLLLLFTVEFRVLQNTRWIIYSVLSKLTYYGGREIYPLNYRWVHCREIQNYYKKSVSTNLLRPNIISIHFIFIIF